MIDVQVGNNSVVRGNRSGALRFETRSAGVMLKASKAIVGRIPASICF